MEGKKKGREERGREGGENNKKREGEESWMEAGNFEMTPRARS